MNEEGGKNEEGRKYEYEPKTISTAGRVIRIAGRLGELGMVVGAGINYLNGDELRAVGGIIVACSAFLIQNKLERFFGGTWWQTTAELKDVNDLKAFSKRSRIQGRKTKLDVTHPGDESGKTVVKRESRWGPGPRSK